MQVQKQYNYEFKKEAIRLIETIGETVTEIDRGLGIMHGLVGKWQNAFRSIQ